MYRGHFGPLEGLVSGEMAHIRATIWAAIERLNEPPIEQLIELPYSLPDQSRPYNLYRGETDQAVNMAH